MRVSDISAQEMLVRTMAENQTAVLQRQQAISSGKRNHVRSDSPADTAAATRLRASQRQAEQWQKSVDVALTWSQITESRISQTVEQLQSTNEILVQAKDATYNAANRRDSLAVEVDAILESLVQTANAKNGDSYLFAGTNSADPPVTVTRDANGQITAVSYSATVPAARTVQVGSETEFTYGTAAVGDGNGLFVNNPWTPSQTDIFSTLIGIRDTLKGTTMPTDEQMSAVRTALDAATSRLVENGVQQKRLETMQLNYLQTSPAVEKRLSNLEDTDMAKEITELNLMQAALSASMQLAGRIGQMSLADYL